MRRRWGMVAVVVGCLVARGIGAQTPSNASGPIGTWRGTSTCLVRPSACHDEVTVYRITRVGAGDSVSIDAFKIVNGQEEEMGVLPCRADAPNTHVTCAMPTSTWRFTVRGDSLVGELWHPNNVKFRDVRAARSK